MMGDGLDFQIFPTFRAVGFLALAKNPTAVLASKVHFALCSAVGIWWKIKKAIGDRIFSGPDNNFSCLSSARIDV